MSGAVTGGFLDAVYESGLSAGDWRPALTWVRDSLNSAEVSFVFAGRGARDALIWETTGAVMTRSENERYGRDYWQCDPKMQILAQHGRGFVFNDIEHFDDGFVARDPFYQEYTLPLGLRHTIDLFADSLDGGDVYLAAMRTAKQGHFDADAIEGLRAAAGHFVRALKARTELARTQSAANNAQAALDALRFGISVVDSSGKVLFSNAFARAAFANNGCIDPARAHAGENPLPRTLREAVQGRPGNFRLRNGEDWLVSAVPLNAATPLAPSSRAAAMLLYRRASEPASATADQVKALYGLTDAEAEIAVGIAQGKSLRKIAAERKVKLSTVRWQLLAVLRKLGVARQADVVRVLAAMNPRHI